MDLPDLDINFIEDYFAFAEAEVIYQQLYTSIQWQSHQVKVFNKWYDQPRLTAVYGNPGIQYSYSKLTMETLTWPKLLLELKNNVEKQSGHSFNLCLCNLYRDGQDSNGWHSDDEKELGENPVIASLSFGDTRKFRLKHKTIPEHKLDMELTNGSLLVMKGKTQTLYKHQIPKTTQPKSPRINLTFRKIVM